jgi:hypothetical protein
MVMQEMENLTSSTWSLEQAWWIYWGTQIVIELGNKSLVFT